MEEKLKKVSRDRYEKSYTDEAGEHHTLRYLLQLEYFSGEIADCEFQHAFFSDVSPIFADLESEDPFVQVTGPEALKKIFNEDWKGFERKRRVIGEFVPEERVRLGVIKEGSTFRRTLPITITIHEEREPRAGRMWHQTRNYDEWPDRAGTEQYVLEAYAPPEIFDDIDATLARGERPKLTAHLKIEFYRTDAERGFEEPYYQRDYLLDHEGDGATWSFAILWGLNVRSPEVSSVSAQQPEDLQDKEREPNSEQVTSDAVLAIQNAQLRSINSLKGWVSFAALALAVLAGAAVTGMLR